jgi:hypothetical protein
MTIINYNNGRISDKDVATAEADKVRKRVTVWTTKARVSFNDGAEESVIVDQLHPPRIKPAKRILCRGSRTY